MEDGRIVRAPQALEKQVLARQMRQEMIPTESRLWQCLRRNQLEGLHFRRQQIIDGFIVDFYCHSAKLVVECDGNSHLKQAAYDKERDKIIAANNLQIMRFSNVRIQHDLEVVLDEIAAVARTYIAQHY